MYWCHQKQPRSQERNSQAGYSDLPTDFTQGSVWDRSAHGTFASENWKIGMWDMLLGRVNYKEGKLQCVHNRNTRSENTLKSMKCTL